MSNLESAAVLLSAVACFYYGFYGLSLIGTTRKCETLTVWQATTNCMVAFAGGGILILLQQWMRSWSVGGAQTFGSQFSTATTEGSYFRGMAWRWILSLLLYGAVVVWANYKITIPLSPPSVINPGSGSCTESTDTTDATFAFAKSARDFLDSIPVTGVVLCVYGVAIMFNVWQMHSYERHYMTSHNLPEASHGFGSQLWGTAHPHNAPKGHHRKGAADYEPQQASQPGAAQGGASDSGPSGLASTSASRGAVQLAARGA